MLARAIGVWGWDALERMEGMWAFALYDAATGELSLCRDRFGEKPLHMHRDAHGLWFASEPPALFALMGRASAPDREHLRRFLVNGYKALGTVGEHVVRGRARAARGDPAHHDRPGAGAAADLLDARLRAPSRT